MARRPARLAWPTVWAAGCALAAACGGKAAQDAEPAEELPAVDVRCQVVTARDVPEEIEAQGVLAPRPAFDALMSSPVAGRIGQLFVDEGDAVAAGARLASIEDPALPAGRAETTAQVAAARAGSEAAALELARQARLFEAGISARKELDDAAAAAASAKAELEAALARAGLAVSQLSRRELRAPHAGVVLHVWKRVGESVDGTTATPVVEVADLSVVEVRAQLLPAELARVREGMAAQVRAPGSAAALPALVVRVPPWVDATTGLATVRLQLAGAPRLPMGGAVAARIVVGARRGLTVPTEALRRSELGVDEVVQCQGGRARVREVQVGARGEAEVEVRGGLEEGAAVVVDRVLGLEEGQRLSGGGAKR